MHIHIGISSSKYKHNKYMKIELRNCGETGDIVWSRNNGFHKYGWVVENRKKIFVEYIWP